MIRRRVRRWHLLVVMCAIFLGATAAMQRPEIPTGGAPRRVAGQVYVIAGAGGNIAVQAGDDGLLLVDDNFTLFYDQIMAAIRHISAQPIRSNLAPRPGPVWAH